VKNWTASDWLATLPEALLAVTTTFHGPDDRPVNVAVPALPPDVGYAAVPLMA